jgi:drug/metabolite transporter (DMT)-like permease
MPPRHINAPSMALARRLRCTTVRAAQFGLIVQRSWHWLAPARHNRARFGPLNPSLLWIPATLIAALTQTARNAMQRNLTGTLGTVGATQVRFLYGLPFALLFLGGVLLVGGESLPEIDARSLAFTLGGAVTQILATALMLLTMKERSFSVTIALIKLEPVLVAVAGILVLRDIPTPLAGFGIIVATCGVVLLSLKPGTAMGWTSGRPIALGILAAGLFALSAIGFRGAIIHLPTGSFVIRATTILVISLFLQTAILVSWMALFNRPALVACLRAWRPSLLAGLTGALASQFWFIGFSLTSAANVRTLALVEVLFAQAVSHRLMAQATSRRDLTGIVLIVAGVGLLLAYTA